MNKIRVAQVITRLDWGGSPDIFRILAGNLDPKIYDVTLIAGPTQFPSLKTSQFLDRFGAETIIVPALQREIIPALDAAAFAHLWAIFMKGKFDIVHTHTAKAGALGRLAARLCGVPVVIHTPHGHNFYGYFGPRTTGAIMGIERFLARLTDRVIALTELEKMDYVTFNVAPAGKVDVIYQGLELETFVRDRKDAAGLKEELGIGPGDTTVGVVGRLEPVKGSPYFVEAAGLIAAKFPNTKFVIVGEGSLRVSLEAKARDLGLGTGMVFTGWRDDVPRMLSIMDIVAMPSLNEAVGMTLIEAQAMGIPVVATNVGGIPEVVRNNETGILVPPENAPALAEAVMELLSDAAKRRRMGEAAAAWVRGRFRAEGMAARTSELYMKLLRQKTSRTTGGR